MAPPAALVRFEVARLLLPLACALFVLAAGLGEALPGVEDVESRPRRRLMSASISSIVRVSRFSLLSCTRLEGLNPAFNLSRAEPVAVLAPPPEFEDEPCRLDLSRADVGLLLDLALELAPSMDVDATDLSVPLLESRRAPALMRASAIPPVVSPSSRKRALRAFAAFSSRV
jgi:hypothetical protein